MLWNKYILLEWESSARVLQLLLTSCLQGYGFQSVFLLVFPAYTLQLLPISVLPTAFKKFCSNKRGLLTLTPGTFWTNIKSGRTQFFDRKVGIDISAPCTRESKNKFGSKCDAFGADMSSRMSAPGISCSKETVLCIEFMMSTVQHVLTAK